MRLLTAVLFASLALVACGDDDGGDESEAGQETIRAGDTPADLRNLWEENMEPDAELVVLETEGGPMYLHEELNLAFGTCEAMDAFEGDDPFMSKVCNP